MSIGSTVECPTAVPARRGVPWATVLPVAVVMAYANGFWLTSLRGAVGAIERTQGPFASWLRESTLALPAYVFVVLGALTVALRLFGSTPRRLRLALTALMVVAAGTVAGTIEMAANRINGVRVICLAATRAAEPVFCANFAATRSRRSAGPPCLSTSSNSPARR